MRKYLLLFAILITLVILAFLQRKGVFWTPPASAQALQGVVESKNIQELPKKIYVVATWEAETGMSSRHCVHLEVTTTDSNGNWSFPMWRDWRDHGRAVLFIEVYSPGLLATAESIDQDKWQLAKHNGSRLKYLEYLSRLRVYCGSADRSNSNGVVVWKAILQNILETRQSTIQLSEEEEQLVNSLRWAFAVKVVDPNLEARNNVRYEKAEILMRELRVPSR